MRSTWKIGFFAVFIVAGSCSPDAAEKSGAVLFLHLQTGLDLQTLNRLARCSDRATLIKRALAQEP